MLNNTEFLINFICLKMLGVAHVDELPLLLRNNAIPSITTPEDIQVSAMMLDLWTSFAKNGYYYSIAS